MKKHSIWTNGYLSTAVRLNTKKIIASLLLILCFGISPAWGAKPGAIYYVNASATGGDGTSWAKAFTDLQSALDAAVSGDKIWVAAGTYKPTNNSDRSVSFILKSGVKIYGGFAGDENQLHKRKLDPTLSVLSGDIGTIGDDKDNSYHVVYADGVTDAVLDGFTVTLGYGDNFSAGAGMYNNNSVLTVSNCIFSYNKVAVGTVGGWATGRGGGMYNKNSAPIVTNCTFSANQAGNASSDKMGAGGGMYNEGYFDNGVDRLSPVITGCIFSDNIASSKGDPQYGGGGGMYNHDGSPTIDRCTFTRNLAALGGGMLNYLAVNLNITNCIFNTNSSTYLEGRGGAIYNLANANILNCTFYQNGWKLFRNGSNLYFRPFTIQGGAIYDERSGSTITNCIFSKNGARYTGGAVYSYAGHFKTTLTNCLFFDNIQWPLGYEDHSIDHVFGNTESISSLYDIDPLLVDPAGGDFSLRYDSPCIDAGYNGKHGNYSWPALPATDFYGNKRIMDGDDDGVPSVDIGVHEFFPNLTDLGAFLQDLVDTGKIEPAVADALLDCVDAALAALAQNDSDEVRSILNELIAYVRASLGDTDTAQVIERKTEAVIEEI